MAARLTGKRYILFVTGFATVAIGAILYPVFNPQPFRYTPKVPMRATNDEE